MKNNIGTTDRVLRLAGGVALFGVALAALVGALNLGTSVGALALLGGVVLVGTALTRMCPIYRLVGVDTCRSQ